MDVAHSGESDRNSGTDINFVYIVEEETGYCYLHFYSESEVREYGTLLDLEASLFARFLWFERLGMVVVEQFPNGTQRFSEHTIQRLLLRSSRRMTPTADCSELEYLPMDSRNSLKN
jgi:hypothetical protein